ncbi:MAG: glycosyltransferase [Muribaculaceae bacterium]
MKILHIITSLATGGAEHLMVDLLPRLREKDNDVELLVFDGTETPFMRQLCATGIVVHRLNNGGSVYNPLNVLKLVPFIRRYDVIHTHNTACQLFAPLARVLSFGGAKLVTTEHNTTNRRREKWYFKPIDRWMYARYSTIIAISEKANQMLHAYVHPKGLVTIENGINVALYAEAMAARRDELVPNYAEGDVVIVMVAAFREQKDQDCAIRAIAELPENYKLCLVGGGVRRIEIETLIASLGLQHRVRLLGIRSDVPQILKAADVNVLASHWEGLSLSSVEGMAAGRPFVASDVNGLREVVGGHGVLFADGNHHELAQIIRRLVSNRNEYDNVAKACAQAATNYDISFTVERYNLVYEELCRKKR